MDEQLIQVEVAYARPDKQVVLALQVLDGVNVEEAIIASGILQQYPEIEFEQVKVGIFGQVCDKEKLLEIEFYNFQFY